MSKTPEHPDPSPDALSRGYEWTHMRLRWVLALVIGFVLCALVMHVSLWFVLRAFENNPRPVDQPRSVVRATESAPEYAPPLQPSPVHDRLPEQDLALMRQREDAVFADLGWTLDPLTHRRVPPAALIARIAQRYPSTAPSTTQPGGIQ
jgi:hypothetical protein